MEVLYHHACLCETSIALCLWPHTQYPKMYTCSLSSLLHFAACQSPSPLLPLFPNPQSRSRLRPQIPELLVSRMVDCHFLSSIISTHVPPYPFLPQPSLPLQPCFRTPSKLPACHLLPQRLQSHQVGWTIVPRRKRRFIIPSLR